MKEKEFLEDMLSFMEATDGDTMNDRTGLIHGVYGRIIGRLSLMKEDEVDDGPIEGEEIEQLYVTCFDCLDTTAKYGEFPRKEQRRVIYLCPDCNEKRSQS